MVIPEFILNSIEIVIGFNEAEPLDFLVIASRGITAQIRAFATWIDSVPLY